METHLKNNNKFKLKTNASLGKHYEYNDKNILFFFIIEICTEKIRFYLNKGILRRQ